MSIFNTNREKELEKSNEYLVKSNNELRTELRLKDSNNAVQYARALAEHNVAIAELEGQLQVAESDIDNEVERRVKSFKAQNAQDIAQMKRELKNEYENKILALEKSNKALVEENGKLTGHNKGFEETNKVLTKQLDSTTATLTTLIGNVVKGLPTVSAEITTPDINVAGARPEQKK